MKKIFTLLALMLFLNTNAQIGGGWDWAFNTGSLESTFKHLKYTPDGSEILMGGTALAAVKFGATTLTAPPQPGNPGIINFFGKINASTGVQTIIRSFTNIPFSFDCITTDDAGNFYTGGGFFGQADFDLGNGVIVPASALNSAVIIKYDATGSAIWAKVFPLGTVGSSTNQIFKLAVAPSGNVFFWGFNFSANSYPLYKLDSNGNTLWFKNGTSSGIIAANDFSPYLKDKFIDNDENVHLFFRGTGSAGFTFDGVSYPVVSGNVYSMLISLNTAGTSTMAKLSINAFTNFQVNRVSGNLSFSLIQPSTNPSEFQNLPNPLASLSTSAGNYFSGIVETDKNYNLLKAKDFSYTIDNPFRIDVASSKFIALPNGKLIIAAKFVKGIAYAAGVNSLYLADASKHASAIIETDINWNMEKFITGGKAGNTSQTYIAAYNDTYLLGAEFSAVDTNGTITVSDLPTTSFGTVNLTGFNAAPDFTTAYGIYSTSAERRKDVAIVQCKSANFPQIASTTWLGITNNWNATSNWSNGIPTNQLKAIFNAPTAFYPAVATTPTAATLEVLSGVALPLPATLLISGGLKNEGTINLNMTGSGIFQGFGAKEWKGNGTVNFSGTVVNFVYPVLFTNSLILNTNLTTSYFLTIPTISLNGSKVNLSGKTLSLTNASPAAISGANATNYFYGGTLKRKINPSGLYEFPVGTASNFQSATVNANNLAGTTAIASTFAAGAITGTTPATTLSGVAINSALNAGWYTISPNNQPTSGTYDVTLKLQNSTNSVPVAGKYTIIKRNDAASPWAVQGNFTLASILSNTVTASNTGINSFSDFAIGIGSADITLGTTDFENNLLKLNLYPNPTSDILNLEMSNSIENGIVKIILLTGQIILEQKNLSGTNFNIDVSNLNSGLYLIQLSDKNQIYNAKFIKK